MAHPVELAIEVCLQAELARINNKTDSFPKHQNIAKFLVAYSGGLDSSVLLHALIQVRQSNDHDFELAAVHVDHQLQSQSQAWSEFCAEQCRHYNIICHIKPVSIQQNSSDSLEALARAARYQVFRDLMDEHTFLLTAHHADDQFETFLLQLFRGAGPKGLSAMASGRELSVGKHLRPLLHLSRAQLEDYAALHDLKYVDDPTNQSSRFDRNFLRNELIPKISQRYPGVQRALLRSVKHIASEHQVLDRFLHSLLKNMADENILHLQPWLKLEPDVQGLVLRKWLSERYTQLPSTKILDNLLLQLRQAHRESKTLIQWADVEIRTYKNKAFLLKQVDEESYRRISGCVLKSGQAQKLSYDYGSIEFHSARAGELELRLTFREGGEKLRESGHTHHTSLKQLFQKKGVVPWMRSRIPLLFEGEQLVAVGDLWLNADWLEPHKSGDFSVKWHNRPGVYA